MDQTTREALEFDDVLHEIAGWTSTPLGAAWVRRIEPLEAFDATAARHETVRQAMHLCDTGRTLPIDLACDIGDAIAAARTEGHVIDLEWWPHIASALGAADALLAFGREVAEECPLLASLLGRLEPLPELAAELARAFDREGRLKDTASPELAAARAGLRRAEANHLRAVERALASLRGGDALQEEFSTIRNGRHVLPVRASAKGKVKGVIHGSSASGETAYVEPFAVVEAGNEVELAHDREAAAVHKVLRALTALLRPHAAVLSHNQGLFAEIDGTWGIARHACRRGWHIPVVTESGPLKLFAAHHPLLHIARAETSIPVSITLEPADRTIILTGPNAGGKTTAMKTVGLTVLLLRCGIPVPASPDSRAPLFAQVFADIGDHQDLGEGISTFSGRMRRLRAILDDAGEASLVLLDEMGAGTDPDEGAALAQAVLEELASRGGLTFLTSHLDPLKSWAEEATGVRNASFRLDPATHRPTFELRLDVPGASEALQIARHEGIPDWILGRARDLLGRQKVELGELLERLEAREQSLAQAQQEAEARAQSLERQERLAQHRAEALREERRQWKIETADQQATAIRTVRDRIERMIADLPSEEQLRQRREALAAARAAAVDAAGRAAHDRRNAERELQGDSAVERAAIEPGNRLYVIALDAWGEVIEVDGGSNRARLRIGHMESWLPLSGLSLREPTRQAPPEPMTLPPASEQRKTKRKKSKRLKNALQEPVPTASSTTGRKPTPKARTAQGTAAYTVKASSEHVPMELDLHGYRVLDAMEAIDKYLDRALLIGYPYVRLIHGTGQGKLYRAVHEFLRDHPSRPRFRFGTESEGGGGVTIVEF